MGTTSKKLKVSTTLKHLFIADLLPLNMLDSTFFPGRAARIFYRPNANPPYSSSQMSQGMQGVEEQPPSTSEQKTSVFDSIKAKFTSALPLSSPKDLNIGIIGILHPSVLEKFEISYPCSALEFTLEPFKKELKDVWADDE